MMDVKFIEAQSGREWKLVLAHCPRVGDFVSLRTNDVFVVESVLWHLMQNSRVEVLVRPLD